VESKKVSVESKKLKEESGKLKAESGKQNADRKWMKDMLYAAITASMVIL
jgi:hypothetical protein